MSLPKAQLVDPQGNMNLPGMTATGIVTATSLSGVATGSVTNLTGSPDLNVGIVTGSSFVGDGTGHAASLTGTPQLSLGIATATSFIGDATGKAAGLTGTPNLNVGLITATSFVGFVTGDVTGNISGLAVSVTPGVNLGLGVCTAIQYHGNGSGLVGAGSSVSIAQEITATSPETIIDLSDGNLIYYEGQTDTTVGFASTSPAEQITFIRDTNTTFDYNISYSTGGVDFDGTGDYLSLAASSDLNLDGDFTIEAWVKVDDLGWSGTRRTLLANNIGWTSNHAAISLMNSASTGEENTIILYQNTSTIANSYPVTVTPSDGWTHIAITRYGTAIKIFKNGMQAGSTAYSSVTFTFGTGETWIGQISFGSPEQLDGKVSNLRIVKGTALYTGNFIPPSSALTNVTNTKLLCCQSDSSTTSAAVTPGTITANGDPTAGAETIAASGTNNIDATITWPDSVRWNNGTTPTLFKDYQSSAFQIFHLTTGDTGASYQAWEEMKNDPVGPYQLYAWGQNAAPSRGQLGQNTTDPGRSSPTQIPGTWKGNATRGYHEPYLAAFIKNDNTLWVWGKNQGGTLGQNQATAQLDGLSSPTQIPGTTWATVSNGDYAILATKTDGTLWGFGLNEAGGLGLNDKVNRSSPTQIPGTWASSDLLQTGGGAKVIKSDNTMWVWGGGWGGALGLNSWTAYSSPVQLPGSWSDVATGGTNLAVKTNGTLWSWGYTGDGVSGLNVRNGRYSSPTQIGTDTDWGSKVFVGNKTAGALKTDGSLWLWGGAQYGALGQNNTTYKSSPVQVPGGWTGAVLGREYVLATKTDGQLWAWGFNVTGQLGQNSVLHNASSPIQIPGTWADPYVSREGSFALKQV